MTREEAIICLQGLLENPLINKGSYLAQAIEMAIQALSQEPCDDEITLKVKRGALKSRQGDMVIYNVAWLREHWQMEMDIVCGVKPCDDAISRQDAIDAIYEHEFSNWCDKDEVSTILNDLPSVTQKSGKCKNCKYFEYDSVAKVDGIPLIVAHEICNKWGGGCKTKEDGYCYLFEPQASEDKE